MFFIPITWSLDPWKIFYSPPKVQHSWKLALFTPFLIPPHTALIRVSTKYQKLPPFRFLFEIIVSVGHMGPKLFSMTSQHPREHVRYPQHAMKCYRTVSKAIWSEFNKISKSNFLWANSHCFCSKSATKPLILQQKITFLEFIELTSNGFRNLSVPFQDMLWVFSMFSMI